MEKSKENGLSVSVVIPAYNEEESVGIQIESLHKVLRSNKIDYEILVVDDGSIDMTSEHALKAGAKVLKQPINRGYGAALKAGILASKNETIIIIDADCTYPADEIPSMLEKSDEYDMVVGARLGDNVYVPLVRKPAKWFLQKLASYLAGRAIPDLNSGLRVLKRSLVEQYYHLLPSGFSFTTTITLAFLCNDYLIFYHPIKYNKRVGKSKIRPIDAYYFLLLILRTIVYFNPLKIFLPIGAMFFLAGSAKFIYDLFLENLSESAVLGILGAFVIWAIGLLSDQISRMAIHSK
jgi:glycosyltransferase involved in cell wall biosynthesis